MKIASPLKEKIRLINNFDTNYNISLKQMCQDRGNVTRKSVNGKSYLLLDDLRKTSSDYGIQQKLALIKHKSFTFFLVSF